MSSPISFDIPHRLGKAEARSRLANGIGSLERHIPGGAKAETSWSGDRMNMKIAAMGQEISTTIDVFESHVRLELVLPPMLAFFGKQIESVVRKGTAELLEDKNRKG
jgi:hypothetical protein